MIEAAPGNPCRAALLRAASSGVSAHRLAVMARDAGAEVVQLNDAAVAGAATEALLLGALNGSFNVVVLDALGTLASSGPAALVSLGRLADAGVATIISVSEPWISGLAVAPDLGRWLATDAKQRRVAAIRASAAKSDRRPGRPRTAIPDGALALVERMPLERAARELGVGASTLRRWLHARGEEQKLAHLSESPGRAA